MLFILATFELSVNIIDLQALPKWDPFRKTHDLDPLAVQHLEIRLCIIPCRRELVADIFGIPPKRGRSQVWD